MFRAMTRAWGVMARNILSKIICAAVSRLCCCCFHCYFYSFPVFFPFFFLYPFSTPCCHFAQFLNPPPPWWKVCIWKEKEITIVLQNFISIFFLFWFFLFASVQEEKCGAKPGGEVQPWHQHNSWRCFKLIGRWSALAADPSWREPRSHHWHLAQSLPPQAAGASEVVRQCTVRLLIATPHFFPGPSPCRSLWLFRWRGAGTARWQTRRRRRRRRRRKFWCDRLFQAAASRDRPQDHLGRVVATP